MSDQVNTQHSEAHDVNNHHGVNSSKRQRLDVEIIRNENRKLEVLSNGYALEEEVKQRLSLFGEQHSDDSMRGNQVLELTLQIVCGLLGPEVIR